MECILYFILSTVFVALADATETRSVQKHPVKYVRSGDNEPYEGAVLTCLGDSPGPDGTATLQWYKNNSQNSLSSTWKEQSSSHDGLDEIDEKECGLHCKITKNITVVNNNNVLISSLTYSRVLKKDFGQYVCSKSYRNGTQVHYKYYLWETMDVFRPKQHPTKDDPTPNIIAYEGYVFDLFCNFIGLRDDTKIVWLKDGEDITADLKNKKGNFSSAVNLTNDLSSFKLKAHKDMRGMYTCKIENTTYDIEVDDTARYPIEYSFPVRIKGGWSETLLTPSIILIGEVILLAAITIVTSKGGDNVSSEDSDDEDDNMMDKKSTLHGKIKPEEITTRL